MLSIKFEDQFKHVLPRKNNFETILGHFWAKKSLKISLKEFLKDWISDPLEYHFPKNELFYIFLAFMEIERSGVPENGTIRFL